MKKNYVIEGTKNQLEQAVAVLKAMGITIEELDSVVETEKNTPKETKSGKQTSKKSDAKDKDDFPRDKYLSIAKELGCLGKHGVWKACRPTVYKVMNGELTKAKARKEVEAICKEKGWAINK